VIEVSARVSWREFDQQLLRLTQGSLVDQWGTGMDQSLNAWFAQDILVLEAPLERYLMRTGYAKDEIHELRQETYRRVYEAATKERPRSAKSLLFATARQLLLERLGQQGVVSEAGRDLDDLTVLIDEISPEHPVGADEGRVLAQALHDLPARCREVVWMRTVEEKSHKEIAARLGLDEAMVEKHIANATRRFAVALFGSHFSEKPKPDTARPLSQDLHHALLTS
jgi:RNA polymerase sigma-70 factor (ECF subfamily)